MELTLGYSGLPDVAEPNRTDTVVDLGTGTGAIALALDGGGTPSRADSVGPRRIVLGDVMFFDDPDPDHPVYDPSVDDPSTVGHLVDVFTDAGYAVTNLDRVHDQIGVITAERVVSGGRE